MIRYIKGTYEAASNDIWHDSHEVSDTWLASKHLKVSLQHFDGIGNSESTYIAGLGLGFE